MKQIKCSISLIHLTVLAQITQPVLVRLGPQPRGSPQIQLRLSGEKKPQNKQTNKHKFYFIKYSETQCTVNLKHKNSCSRRVYKTKYLNYQGQYILNMYQVANMWVTIYKSPKIEDKREFMDPLDKYKRVQKILEYHFYWATHAFHEERMQNFSSNQFVLMKIIFRENMW